MLVIAVHVHSPLHLHENKIFFVWLFANILIYGLLSQHDPCYTCLQSILGICFYCTVWTLHLKALCLEGLLEGYLLIPKRNGTFYPTHTVSTQNSGVGPSGEAKLDLGFSLKFNPVWTSCLCRYILHRMYRISYVHHSIYSKWSESSYS